MNVFKVGDKVRRVTGDALTFNKPSDNMFEGEVYTVLKADDCSVWLVETSQKFRYNRGWFQLVEEAKPIDLIPTHIAEYLEHLELREAALENLVAELSKQVERLTSRLDNLKVESPSSQQTDAYWILQEKLTNLSSFAGHSYKTSYLTDLILTIERLQQAWGDEQESFNEIE